MRFRSSTAEATSALRPHALILPTCALPPPPPRRVLENVKELWKETPPGGECAAASPGARDFVALSTPSPPLCSPFANSAGKKALTRDRVVPKMFLRGDSVIVVVSGESLSKAGAPPATSA